MSRLIKPFSRLVQPHVPAAVTRRATPSHPQLLTNFTRSAATAFANAKISAELPEVPLITDFKTALATSASSLLHYPRTEMSTLSNGMRVASESSDGETATIGVWVDTGSRYETEQQNGAAHFLEHMVFKGTHRRTRQQLELEVENMGGHLNAYTSREQTVFYAKVFKQDVDQAMDILSDLLLNSRIEDQDIARERETILREMREIDNQLDEVIFDKLHYTAYRGTALGRTILGSEKNIESISRHDIQQYVRRHYTADRMVVAGAGAVSHKKLVELTEKLFSKVPTSAPAGQEPYMEPARFTGSDILIRYDDMPLAHIALGYPTAGWTDPDNFPLMIIQTMLGSWEKSVHGGMHSSSTLVATVAQYDLANSIATFNTQYSDTGLFGVYAVAEPVALNNLVWSICNAITALSYRIDEISLAEAKNQLKMNMLSHLDGTTTICEDIGRQILTYGRRMHIVEVMARIDAVDAAAVKRAANRFFFDRDHALAAIGPIWELPDYNFIRSRSFYLRF